MNALLSSAPTRDETFASSLRGTVRALLGCRRDAAPALAAALAKELQSHPALSALVRAVAPLPGPRRAASLLSAARSFQAEWATLGAADALRRMATRPALFQAVTRELDAA